MAWTRSLILCLLFVFFLYIGLIECGKGNKRQRRQRRVTDVIRRNRIGYSGRRASNPPANSLPMGRKRLYVNKRPRVSVSRKLRRKDALLQKKRRNRRRHKNSRHRTRTRHSWKPNRKIRNEVIQETGLSLSGFAGFLQPALWRDLQVATDTRHLEGVVRIVRLYCRAGIGYHLEIKANGSLHANNAETNDAIVEIFSVKRSVVGIRSAQHSLYLCMNKAGKLFTRKSFQPDCEFRENIEGNNYNTYASEQYSDHRRRVGFFLAITKRGTIPRRMRKVSWKQTRAHWLPRPV